MTEVLFQHVRDTAAILAALTVMTACGNGDDATGGGSDTSEAGAADNVNANFVVSNRYCYRMEFPKVRNDTANRVVVHKVNGEVNYSLEWDCAKRSQRWSCYQMCRSNVEGNVGRTGNGYPLDPDIPEAYQFQADPYGSAVYEGVNVEHGHICASADRQADASMNEQTFYLSNMQPQIHRFNGYDSNGTTYIWLSMENKVREIVRRDNYRFCDTLYVCKGGTIDNDGDYTILPSGLLVPHHFFMALLAVKNGVYHAFAFYVEHSSNSDTALLKYAVSIDTLEELTSIDFFCNLPDARERVIEAQDPQQMAAYWLLN